MSNREQELQRQARAVGTLVERLEQSRTRIAKMCADRRGPRMSIPVEAADDDFFICLALEDAIESLNAAQPKHAEGDFDADLVRLDQIRHAHRSARPTQENPAWMHAHNDCAFLLAFIDKLWAEYSKTLQQFDDQRDELEQEQSIRSDREIVIELIRSALGVEVEPHQTFSDRLVRAAQKASPTDWCCPHFKPRGEGCTECATEKVREVITREPFEEWVRGQGGYDLTRNETVFGRTYEDDKTEHAWRGWACGRSKLVQSPDQPQKGGDGWRENATHLLDHCPHTIRVQDTEHPDTLLTSLVVTFQKMQTLLERASQPSAEPSSDELKRKLAAAGVFKGVEGLEGLLNASEFWEQQSYGTRLYYGPGIADYLHRGVLDAAISILKQPAPTPEPRRLTDDLCDDIVLALASYQWTGFTRDDIRLIAGTIDTYRGDQLPVSENARVLWQGKLNDASVPSITQPATPGDGPMVVMGRPSEPCPQCERLKLELAISNDLGQRFMDQLKALESRPATPTLRAYNEAMQAAGVPHEALEVYTSNSWRRVGLASRHHIVMAPTVWSDGHPDIDCPVMLTALVAAFNAMLELRKGPQS